MAIWLRSRERIFDISGGGYIGYYLFGYNFMRNDYFWVNILFCIMIIAVAIWFAVAAPCSWYSWTTPPGRCLTNFINK